MHQISSAKDVKKLGTILSVWAHPDDESFCAAGIMAAAVNNGQKVICVTATRGEKGVRDDKRWPVDKLPEIREKEMLAALKELGVTNHHWLNYIDGDCDCISGNEGRRQIKKLIEMYQPDTILTFGPDGLTGHPDHQAVSRWARQAAKDTNVKVYQAVEEKEHYEKYMKPMDRQFNIYFNIDKPPIYNGEVCAIAFTLSPELRRKKQRALQAMPSQTEVMFKQAPDFMEASLQAEYFVSKD